MPTNLTEDPKELIRVNKDARGTMDISFDPETAFRIIQDLKAKAKTHIGSNEDFLMTYTKAVEEIQAAINDPTQKTNALGRIRELNNARLLRNSDQLESMLRGLKSPTLDALIKARLNGSLKTELTAGSPPNPDSSIVRPPEPDDGTNPKTLKPDLSVIGAGRTLRNRGRVLADAIDAQGK